LLDRRWKYEIKDTKRTMKKQKLISLLNPIRTIAFFYKNKDLLKQLVRQNILVRYKGSGLGSIWSFITPLFMLAIYTFVFNVIFKTRLTVGDNDSTIAFTLTLFCGIAVFNIFSESINPSSTVIIQNANYVKKVVFPLEILPVTMVVSSLFFGGIWFVVLIVGVGVFLHKICITLICLPLILLPLILFTLGLSWWIASLGVYIRDIAHFVGLGLQCLFFITPIFYPITMVPDNLQVVLQINPLAAIIQEMRNIVLYNIWPAWPMLGLIFAVSLVVFQSGYVWFMKTKHGFADVI